MAKWMLAEDLLTRPGEHPEQVEAAREHMIQWRKSVVGGFDGYEALDITPQSAIDTREWPAWCAKEGATVDPQVVPDPLERGDKMTGREKLLAAGVPEERIVECKDRRIDRVGLGSLTPDEIERPTHYTKGIETIKYIESWEMDFRAANIIKYVTRYPHKGKPLSDLKKARWYINRLIAELEP